MSGGARTGSTSARSSTPAAALRPPVIGRRWSLLLLALVVLVLLAQVITLPYVLMRPGPAVDILGSPQEGAPVVTVEDAPTYPTTGSLYFTTVAQYGGPDRRPSAWDVAAAWVDPSSEIVPESRVYPAAVSREVVQEENSVAMENSQHGAVAVALRALGKPVTEKAVVAEVIPEGPAKGVLRKGDVITRVEKTPVTRASQITEDIQKLKGPVTLTVTRDGVSSAHTMTPIERDGRRVVGVLIQPTFSYGLDVTIHAGDVGGPSAGMMFALGVYDTLTPGSLTGGARIAGTGTLDTSGSVGPIGGIAQKMVGAHDTGAGFFLAPVDNCSQVVGHVPDGLVVTPVATFDEALHAVEEIGAGRGAALPPCPAS